MGSDRRCRSCRRVLLDGETSECIPECAPGWRREARRASTLEKEETAE